MPQERKLRRRTSNLKRVKVSDKHVDIHLPCFNVRRYGRKTREIYRLVWIFYFTDVESPIGNVHFVDIPVPSDAHNLLYLREIDPYLGRLSHFSHVSGI